jgi:uncharacterized membrane protein
MNHKNLSQLWQTLCDNGLAKGDLPLARNVDSPWYVRVMLGIAGWIGALFLLGFVGVGFRFVMDNAAISMVAGILFCGAAFYLFRVARDNDFGTQFALAVSLAGQVMFAIGVFKAFKGDSPVAYFLAFLFEALLAALVPNFIHRVLNSWGALVILSLGLSRIGIHGVAPGVAAAAFAMVWLDDSRWAGAGELWCPIGYGAALALVQIDGSLLIGPGGWMHEFGEGYGTTGMIRYAPTIGAAVVAAVFMGSMWRLLMREGIAAASRSGVCLLAAAVAVAVFSFAAHGVATALLILLLGYAAGNRVLVGLGLFALGAFLSHYYYQMQTTLLMKSMWLALAGTVLLAGRAAVHVWMPEQGTGERDA